MLTFLTPNSQYAVLGIIGLLIAATIGLWIYRRVYPGRDCRELCLRLSSWWIMVATFTISLAMGRAGSLVFLGMICFLSFREFLALVPHRPEDRPVLFLAYLSIPLQFIWIAFQRFELFISFIPLFILGALSVGMALVGNPRGFLTSLGSLVWGVLLTIFGLSHLGYLIVLPLSFNPRGGALGLMIFLIFLAQTGDVVQFLFGKSMGRHKVIPYVSPGKTWEGLLGGLAVIIILAGVLAPWITPMNHWEGMIAGLLIGVAGFLGDITVSAMKRDLGIKDTGTMIPGHGGILDRVDSLLLSAPVFFHFIYYMHYL